jgi:hypothetical protein
MAKVDFTRGKFTGMKKIYECTLASADNTITITGLDLNAHKFFLIIFSTTILNNDSSVLMYMNNNLNPGSYSTTGIGGTSAGVASFGVADAQILHEIAQNRDGYVWGTLLITPAGNLEFSGLSNEIRNTGVPTWLWFIIMGYSMAETNVTRIDFKLDGAGAQFKAGTKVLIFGEGS